MRLFFVFPSNVILIFCPPEGPTYLPDIIQIHLDLENARLFFEYLLYAYGAKKALDGIAYLGKKILDAIASEVGKDIYRNVKAAIKKLLTDRRAQEAEGPCDPLWIYLRGYLGESILIIRIIRAGDRNVISAEEIQFASGQALDVFAASVLPICNAILGTIGDIGTIIEAVLHTHRNSNNWELRIYKEIPSSSFFVFLWFDARGRIEQFNFKEAESQEQFGCLSPQQEQALCALRDSALSHSRKQE